MCALDWIRTKEDDEFMMRFGVTEGELVEQFERLNYPMSPRFIVRAAPEGKREWAEANWGLIPPWATDPKVGRNTFNCRDDSLAEGKPTFRSAFKTKRCLLVATSYIEYREESGRKLPYEFEIDGGKPYAYAGLWEEWGEGPNRIESCTMVTTEPNELTTQYFQRMPVILDPGDYDQWLDPRSSREELLHLLAPFPADRMSVKPTELPRRPSQQPSLF